MRTATLFGIAVRSLRRRPLRALLTALTAAVAVATVFGARGLLRGADAALEADLGRLGLRTVQVMDGIGFLAPLGDASQAVPLGPADTTAAVAALAAEEVAAEVVAARVALGTVASARAPAIAVPVVATAPGFARTFDAALAGGRFLEDGDLAPDAEPVCVLDADAARSLGGAAVGDRVTVFAGGRSREARVVGVVSDPFRLRPQGKAPDLTAPARRSLAQIFAFRNVYVPRPVLGDGGQGLLLAVAERRADCWRVHDALERALRTEERGLLVWSRGTWARSILGLVREQLAIANVVWGMVLLVALVMIATVTLVGVRERYPEVALRRAEGATRGQVTGQLLWEGGLLALAGGLLGLPCGALVARLLARMLPWMPVHDGDEALLALALGSLVGVLAAALPARRAAGWSVVEGLRRVR